MMMIVFAVPVLLAAFPVGSSANSLSLVSENCIVKEPLYNVTFNFSSLNSELAHHIKSDINEQFMFDVCDKLNFQCNGISDGTACLKRNDNTQVLLGRESQLHLTDGRIHFETSRSGSYWIALFRHSV